MYNIMHTSLYTTLNYYNLKDQPITPHRISLNISPIRLPYVRNKSTRYLLQHLTSPRARHSYEACYNSSLYSTLKLIN
jgi:hypothetical protein